MKSIKCLLVLACITCGIVNMAKAQIYVYKDSEQKEHHVHFQGTGMCDRGSSWMPILPGEDAYYFQLVSDNPSYKLYSYNNTEYQRVNYRKFSNDLKTMESYSILYDGTTKNKGTATLIRIENKQVGSNTNSTWGGDNGSSIYNSGGQSSGGWNGGNSNSSGNDGKNSGSTPPSGQKMKDCPICFGSGKCNNCNGNKIRLVLGEYVNCTNCNATGKCPYCHGTGKVVTH